MLDVYIAHRAALVQYYLRSYRACAEIVLLYFGDTLVVAAVGRQLLDTVLVDGVCQVRLYAQLAPLVVISNSQLYTLVLDITSLLNLAIVERT